MDRLPPDHVTRKSMDEGLGATVSDYVCLAKLLMGLLPPCDIAGVIDEIILCIYLCDSLLFFW